MEEHIVTRRVSLTPDLTPTNGVIFGSILDGWDYGFPFPERDPYLEEGGSE